ncbi:MAG: DSBA oxidoreductase [Chitinophagales bacterium]|nr:MAG: DSBA oxidoreductase [Chitinophagales bacterium]
MPLEAQLFQQPAARSAGDKMRVEIWSDVVCPFCYIGKRNFEKALSSFPHRDKIDIVWKSFQLDPQAETRPDISVYAYLAQRKNISLAQSKQLHEHVTGMARKAGLDYHLDKVIPANTLKAHQMLHFARKQGKQNETKEALLRAYFTGGKNIDDLSTLLQIGSDLGLDTSALQDALLGNTLTDEVNQDIYEARQLGIQGVPYFLFNAQYAVSGAQPPEVFSATLQKAFNAWKQQGTE